MPMKRLMIVAATLCFASASFVWEARGQTAQPPARAAQPAGQAGAKALFYDPIKGEPVQTPLSQPDPTTGRPKVRPVAVTAPAAVKFVGVHYWIELDGAGPVTAERTFKTGD